MSLRAGPIWIGHGGASALAPGNTLGSFALALRLGVDVVEFDVRRCGQRLLLAHGPLDGRRRGCLDLDEALRWLSERAGDDVELVVDLKSRGTAAPAIEALRRHGLADRAVLASQSPPILREARAADPGVRTAISVGGRFARGAQRWRAWREEVVAGLRSGRYGALMAEWRLVDAELVDRVHATRSLLHAWTVGRRTDAFALTCLGVDGIVVADPRLVA